MSKAGTIVADNTRGARREARISLRKRASCNGLRVIRPHAVGGASAHETASKAIEDHELIRLRAEQTAFVKSRLAPSTVSPAVAVERGSTGDVAVGALQRVHDSHRDQVDHGAGDDRGIQSSRH